MYHISISYTLWNIIIIIITRIVHTVITRDVPVERDCNTITVLLLLLFQINNQSINQSINSLVKCLDKESARLRKLYVPIYLKETSSVVFFTQGVATRIRTHAFALSVTVVRSSGD